MTDTTPREEQPLSTARDAALLAAVDELRAADEQLERAVAWSGVIRRGLVSRTSTAPSR
ncbi:hypothetical protein [Streptomyces sp. NPDC001537]